MRTSARYPLGVGVAAGLLAACGPMRPGQNNIPPTDAPAKAAPDRASYHMLHRFSLPGRGGTCCPNASLVNVNGTLYGTTIGALSTKRECGTVFRINSTGAYKTLYRFHGADGCAPENDALINIHGTLYGTTYGGGCCYAGVVFSVTTSGVEKVLYSFKGAPDGANPWGGLVELNGALYGTTSEGGKINGKCPYSQGFKGCGTVYSITTSGTESVLHRFKGTPDGLEPTASMIAVNGKLYSTTVSGGGSYSGTVFSVTTTRSESVVYSFKGGDDGVDPYAALLYRNGKLYGTTIGGGSSGNGTVYSVSLAGAENVLYSFAGGSDGRSPGGRLIDVNGTLYGTTDHGGGSGCTVGGSGCGIIFSLTSSGSENVLYRFQSGSDGANPSAGLANLNGTLYGTTIYGGGGRGCSQLGCGTVFAITP